MAKIKRRSDFCDPGLERWPLSCAMQDKDNFLTIMAKTQITDFLSDEHRTFLILLQSLYGQGVEKFDTAIVQAEAQLAGILNKVGGVDYIELIAETPVDSENLDVYLEKIKDISKKWKLYEQNTKLLDEIWEHREPTEDNKSAWDLIARAENDLLSLSLDATAHTGPINVSEGMREWFENRLTNPVRISGLSMGLPITEMLIDGLRKGDLYVVAAVKKVGKSAMLMNIGAHVAYKLNLPILTIDTEMQTSEDSSDVAQLGKFRTRLVSHVSRVPERRILHGKVNEREKRLVEMGIDIAERGNFFHQYLPGFSVDQVISLFKMYKAKFGIELGIFDYIKMPSNADTRSQKEHQILGDLTTRLKDLAGQLNIPIICAAQVNRSGEVADSDKIERYCDCVMIFDYKSDKEIEATGIKGGRHKLVIRRTRGGGETPKEGISINFNKPILTLREAEVQPHDYENWVYGEDFGDEDYGKEEGLGFCEEEY
jgi:replicative DNA helicase